MSAQNAVNAERVESASLVLSNREVLSTDAASAEASTATTASAANSAVETSGTELAFLSRLADTLESRLPANGGDPQGSYVAKLYSKAPDSFLKKVGEEATEAIIAAKDINIANDTPYETVADDTAVKDLVYEIADVWFHTMVTLAWFNIPSWAVTNELARRFGLSGIDEKAARQIS